MAMCKLVLSQPDPRAPEGRPYGVTADLTRVRWFASEMDAWDYRDGLLEDGFRNVRVLGAPCRAMVIG